VSVRTRFFSVCVLGCTQLGVGSAEVWAHLWRRVQGMITSVAVSALHVRLLHFNAKGVYSHCGVLSRFGGVVAYQLCTCGTGACVCVCVCTHARLTLQVALIRSRHGGRASSNCFSA
jgi:hypothetical protein